MAATYDMKDVRRGNSYDRTFRFKDGDNALVDLSGSIMVFSATLADGTTMRKMTNTPGSGFSMDDPMSGEVSLHLTPIETRLFSVGKMRNRYEIERWIGNSEVTLLAGMIEVSQGVNNDD